MVELSIAKADDVCVLTASELAREFRKKTLSPVTVMEAVLHQLEQCNPPINAFYYVDAETALMSARASEARFQSGQPLGLLDGVPVSIKDSIAVAGIPMLRGAEAYRGRPVPETDSPPAARIRESGAIIFGKTTMPDLGLLGAGSSSAFGVTRNPWNLAYNTSGSSSGSAAALASGIGPLSVGTDLGGSVRLPASFCGLSAIKPTQGLIPHLPPSATRSAGPMARCVEDAAMFLSVLSGKDERDFGSLPPSHEHYHERLDVDVSGWRIGILRSIGGKDDVDPIILEALNKAAQLFEKAGAIVEEIPRVVDFDFVESLRIIFGARGLAEMSQFDAATRKTFHPIVQATAHKAESLSALEFILAGEAVELAKKKTVAATYPFDVVISPASPVVNFPAEDVGPVADDFCSFIHFTSLFNQTGQPAAVTCAGFNEGGLPFGLQFVGRRFDDLRVLQAAAFFERQKGHKIRWPME